MCRHTLRNVECQALRQDSKVHTDPPTDLHCFLHGVVYLVHTGIPWRDLPPRFGHWNRVFRRYCCWCQAGVWTRLLVAPWPRPVRTSGGCHGTPPACGPMSVQPGWLQHQAARPD